MEFLGCGKQSYYMFLISLYLIQILCETINNKAYPKIFKGITHEEIVPALSHHCIMDPNPLPPKRHPDDAMHAVWDMEDSSRVS